VLDFHGYGGPPEGSIRALFDDLATVMGRRAALGDVSFPELPFSHQADTGVPMIMTTIAEPTCWPFLSSKAEGVHVKLMN